MFTRKIKYIIAVNLILFIGVVFLGIEQAGRGAEISNLEDKLETLVIQKRDLTEEIFRSGNDSKLTQNVTDLGFVKPSNVLYFNSIETVASIR